MSVNAVHAVHGRQPHQGHPPEDEFISLPPDVAVITSHAEQIVDHGTDLARRKREASITMIEYVTAAAKHHTRRIRLKPFFRTLADKLELEQSRKLTKANFESEQWKTFIKDYSDMERQSDSIYSRYGNESPWSDV
jgi:hypothetical protein